MRKPLPHTQPHNDDCLVAGVASAHSHQHQHLLLHARPTNDLHTNHALICTGMSATICTQTMRLFALEWVQLSANKLLRAYLHRKGCNNLQTPHSIIDFKRVQLSTTTQLDYLLQKGATICRHPTRLFTSKGRNYLQTPHSIIYIGIGAM